MGKTSSLITWQEVEEIQWRHEVETQMEEFMNLTWAEKRKRASDRMDEKINVILKLNGISKTIQEAMEECEKDSMLSAPVNEQDLPEQEFPRPESNHSCSLSKVQKNEPRVFDKSTATNEEERLTIESMRSKDFIQMTLALDKDQSLDDDFPTFPAEYVRNEIPSQEAIFVSMKMPSHTDARDPELAGNSSDAANCEEILKDSEKKSKYKCSNYNAISSNQNIPVNAFQGAKDDVGFKLWWTGNGHTVDQWYEANCEVEVLASFLYPFEDICGLFFHDGRDKECFDKSKPDGITTHQMCYIHKPWAKTVTGFKGGTLILMMELILNDDKNCSPEHLLVRAFKFCIKWFSSLLSDIFVSLVIWNSTNYWMTKVFIVWNFGYTTGNDALLNREVMVRTKHLCKVGVVGKSDDLSTKEYMMIDGEMNFGDSSLVLRHLKSGVRIHFNGFDVLLGWKQEALPPVEVPAAAKWKF